MGPNDAKCGPLRIDPERECCLCPRLVTFRTQARVNEPLWHNGPVPSFGKTDARVLIVGLAPGLRGANRTGRPFTGDFAGELLYRTLVAHGFAQGTYGAHAQDGLQLSGSMITNAVRCVPPGNKPIQTEINTCRPFLTATIEALGELRAIVALGRIAHDSVLRACGVTLATCPFSHGAEYAIETPNGRHVFLFDSYHCSRYNTNTGVLTDQMFQALFANVRRRLDCGHLT